MDIKNLSDLAKIADLCRKKGIEQIKISNGVVEFKLGDKPSPMKPRGKSSEKAEEKEVTEGQPTEADYLFWSADVAVQGVQ